MPARIQRKAQLKVKVKIIVTTSDTERVINAIVSAVRTSKIGDGKIFVRVFEYVPAKRVMRRFSFL